MINKIFSHLSVALILNVDRFRFLFNHAAFLLNAGFYNELHGFLNGGDKYLFLNKSVSDELIWNDFEFNRSGVLEKSVRGVGFCISSDRIVKKVLKPLGIDVKFGGHMHVAPKHASGDVDSVESCGAAYYKYSDGEIYVVISGSIGDSCYSGGDNCVKYHPTYLELLVNKAGYRIKSRCLI